MAFSGVARSPAGEPGSQSDYRARDYQCHDQSHLDNNSIAPQEAEINRCGYGQDAVERE
jgi:hypothetical protein